MEIKLVEKNSLQLTGKKEVVLVNPTREFLKKSTARIIVYNQPVENGLLTDNNRVIINGPGEFEIGGVEINGFGDGNGGTIYSLVVEGVTIGVMGVTKDDLSDKKVERFGSADVLIVDISQNDTAKDKTILKLAKGMGVNYLIPVGSKKEDKEMIDFLNVVDNEGLEPVTNLKIEKDGLPEGLEVVILHE